MRSVVAAPLLALLMQTACATPSYGQQVSFTMEQANAILDSLQARGDWQRMYAIQTARLNNRNTALDNYVMLDSLSKVQLIMCDSVRRKQYGEIGELRSENSNLTRKVKARGLTWPVMLAIGVIIGVLVQ